MNPSNRLRLNYSTEAQSFTNATPQGIVDIHSHIQGEAATRIYAEAASHYGVTRTYSMTHVSSIPTVQQILGDKVRFIAIPNFSHKDRVKAFGSDFAKELPLYGAYGAKIAKFWSAPRIYEATGEPFATNALRINSPARMEAMKAAVDLGMIFMAHIGDPDTWFQAKYKDANKYGTKLQQYEIFQEVLERFPIPWIAAHMGGSPENLGLLSNLLSRHSNLYLDCSATKWIVRELSKHPLLAVRQFFEKWKGRLLFGSDIVATDAHISKEQSANEMDAKANSHDEAYDLYASRYWAFRTLFETSYEGDSPIADPDLQLVEPERYSAHDAPRLRGISLEADVLYHLYRGNATRLGL